MRGHYPEEGSIAVDERSGLNRAKSGRCCHFAVCGKARICVDVLDKDRTLAAHCSPASGSILPIHRSEVLEKVETEAPLGNDGKVAGLWFVQLNVSQVCAVHPDRKLEESVQHILKGGRR